jgi:hypothetical protein
MIGALLLGAVAGTVGRMLVPDMFSGMSGPKSWLLSLALGLGGAIVGYVIFAVGLAIGDTNVFDFGGIIGVTILLPFAGVYARFENGTRIRSARQPASPGFDGGPEAMQWCPPSPSSKTNVPLDGRRGTLPAPAFGTKRKPA